MPLIPRLKIILLGGGFLIADQTLKYLSLHNWQNFWLPNKFFGWQPFINTGAAFGLPIYSWIIIILTIPIIIFLIYILFKEKNIFNFFGYNLILWGALSNLIDRIYYGGVIDYWRLFTGIINLGDVMIVGGLIVIVLKLYFLNEVKQIKN